MAVRFIFGRAGAGKTRYCLDALAAELQAPESRRLILLAPEQAGFELERALVRTGPRGGFTRAEVLSFTRLAQRVLQSHGAAAQLLTPQQRLLALRRLAASRPEAFASFGAALHTPGFFAELDRVLQDLLRDGLGPDRLAALAETSGDELVRRRVAGLARAHAAYLDWLGQERLDPILAQQQLRRTLQALDWLPAAHVWVDGFAGFTGQEAATLVALAGLAERVEITLLIDPGQAGQGTPPLVPLDLFHRTDRTLRRLRAAFAAAGVTELPPVELGGEPLPRFRAPDLARLERGLALGESPDPFTAGAAVGAAPAAPPAVAILDCPTPREELRRAARWIRRKLLDANGSLRLRDFAIIARDLEPIAPLVEEVFAEFELPCFLDRRRSLSAHALPRFIAALLECVASDFHHRPTAALLRSGLLPLQRWQSEKLEDLVLTYEIRGRRLWRRAAWDFRSGAVRGAAAQDPGDEHFFEARRAIQEAIDPLADLAAESRAGRSVAAQQWARGLYAVLEALGVRARLQEWIVAARGEGQVEAAELHRQSWDALCGLLDDVDAVLGDVPLTLAEFDSLVRGVLRSTTVGLAPPMLDQVLVSSIERSRHPDVRCVWIVGLNDGIFPRRPLESPLLSTAERELLAGECPALADRRDEAFHERLLAYIACTRASEHLVLSFARSGPAGDDLHPSPLLDLVRAALPQVAEREAQPGLPPVGLRDFAQEYLRRKGMGARAADEPTPWQNYEQLLAGLKAPPARRAPAKSLFDLVDEPPTSVAAEVERLLRAASYDNKTQPVAPPPPPEGAPPEVVWGGAPTELNEYLQCPFKHFAGRRLRLRERRTPARFELETGDVMHQVLADVLLRVVAAGEPVHTLPDATWHAHFEAAFDAWLQRQDADAAARRPAVVFMLRAQREPLRELVTAHAARYRAGPLVPLAAEQQFGRPPARESGPSEAAAASGREPSPAAAPAPPCVLELGDGRRAYLHGQIDRIDEWQHGGERLAVVYDFKSRLPPLLKNARWLSDNWLQLMLYCLAVRQGALGPLRPVGVFLAPLRPDTEQIRRLDGSPASPADLARLLMPRGVMIEDLAVQLVPPNATTSEVISLTLKKNGTPNHHADVTPERDLLAREEQARETAAQVITGIVAGEVAVRPLVEGNTLPCQYCPHRPVCRFELGLDPTRRAERDLPRRPAAEPGADPEALDDGEDDA